VQVTNCIDVSSIVIQGCEAFFRSLATTGPGKKKKKKKRKARGARVRGFAGPAPQSAAPLPPIELPPLEQLIPPLGDETPEPPSEPTEPESEPGSATEADMKQARAFLRYLLGSEA
jgi:hypothetical protein